MSKRTGPYKRVKVGNVTIPIYRTANPKAEAGFEFKVAYYQHDGDGKTRRIKTFADVAKAEKFAENVNAAITKGDSNTLTLTGDEFLAYRDAVNSLPAGVRLTTAVHEYAAAIKKLKDVPLAVAIEGYLKAFAKMRKKNVQSIVDELVEFKRTNKRRPVSAVYLQDLRLRLDKFAEAFNLDIDEITTAQVEGYLAGLKVSGRTQFNYGRLVRTLFNFAEARHYLPKDSNPFNDIDLDYDDDGKIEIFTPDEMRQIMDAARPEMIPFIALGGFAGLRHAEIRRLDWADISEKEIRIEKAKSKTRQNRVIEIQPNLAKWLAPHRQKSGPVVEFVHTSKQLAWLTDAVNAKLENSPAPKFKWKHNAMRHSFVSYSFALRGAKDTASEAGHSENMLFANYRSLVTADAAKEWFAIEPKN